MDRSEPLRHIDGLYGAPGGDHDTETGRELLMELLERHGVSILNDDALAELAGMHLSRDARPRR